MDLQLSAVLESERAVTCPPVGLVVHLGTQVACSCGRREVVLWLVVSCRIEHCPRTVAPATHFHGLVVLRDQLSIETRTKKQVQRQTKWYNCRKKKNHLLHCLQVFVCEGNKMEFVSEKEID